MRSTVILAVTSALLALVVSKSYEGYKVYNIVTKTDYQNAYLESLSEYPDFDFWSEINQVGEPVLVMVAPRAQGKFENYLKVNGFVHNIEIENVESTIQNEKQYRQKKSIFNSRSITFDQNYRPLEVSRSITFDQYYRHSEINNYLASLVRSYPDIVSLETIGQSYHGRNMSLIRISTEASNSKKPVILVDAGIHGREWIAPALALYLINQLVENPLNRYLIENVDWIVLPVVNPDGYEYSWDADRFWRKTNSSGTRCNGADANRNFDFHWMEIGASKNECSKTYAGKSPFSEVETRNLRDFILKTPNIKAYLTLHSYGRYLLYPWGWTSSLPDNWKELNDLAQRMNNAIRNVNGTTYTIGSSNNVLYGLSGTSRDWARGVAGINISYTVELPGGGARGFDLLASRIAGVVVETFEAFKVIADHVGNL